MDDTAFEELLAFLAQDDSGCVGLELEGLECPAVESLDEDSSSPPDVSPVTAYGDVFTAKPKSSKTRKQELVELREYVAQLAETLRSLKTAAGIDWTTPVARSQSQHVNTLESSQHERGLWRKLAARQLQLRRASEQENAAMRMLLSKLVRRAKRLQATAQKRALNESRQLSPFIRQQGEVFPASLADDRVVWSQLSAGLANMYNSIDTTFHMAEMHRVPRPGRSGKMLALENSGHGQPVICQVHILPFDYHMTEQAVWQFFSQDPANRENDASTSIKFSYTHPAGTFVMHQRAVVRRFREENRTVVVNRALTEAMPGISSHSLRFVVIKEGERSVCGPTTVLEVLATSANTTPEVQARVTKLLIERLGKRPQDPKLKFSPWEKALDKMMSDIENLLVTKSVLLAPSSHDEGHRWT